MVRTKKDVENDRRVESLHFEDDGCYERGAWWVLLKAGWQWDNEKIHFIHEPTIKKICFELNYSVTEWPDDPELTIVEKKSIPTAEQL